MSQEQLERRILRFIREHRLASGQPLVVAVSGGADSVCLLHVLSRLREELDLRLHAAHLDHRLRGAESEADARYVSDLSRRLNIPATIEQRDVKAYQSEMRLSPEEAAREVRYAFLTEVAESIGADRTATGHTADDHIETILMHLIRGSGTRGLQGLQPRSRWKSGRDSLTIIRPLLEISRQETAEYCRRHMLAPRMDTSNLSLSPLRNRLRLQLLPLLESYNPRIGEALLRTSRLAADELAFMEEESSRLWDKIARERENTVVLDRKHFLALPPALKRQMLLTSVEKVLGDLKDIEMRHVEEMMDALGKPAGRSLNLPDGLTLSIEYDRYLLGKDPAALIPFPPLKGKFQLNIPGETLLPGWHVESAITKRPAAQRKPSGVDTFLETPTPLPFGKGKGTQGMGFTNNLFIACFDLAKTGSAITVRSRQLDDRFQPLGMSQPKKLNEFMVDEKIPRSWRQRIPIVCSSEHILWVVGWRMDDRVKVTEATQKVLSLKFECRNKPE